MAGLGDELEETRWYQQQDGRRRYQCEHGQYRQAFRIKPWKEPLSRTVLSPKPFLFVYQNRIHVSVHSLPMLACLVSQGLQQHHSPSFLVS